MVQPLGTAPTFIVWRSEGPEVGRHAPCLGALVLCGWNER